MARCSVNLEDLPFCIHTQPFFDAVFAWPFTTRINLNSERDQPLLKMSFEKPVLSSNRAALVFCQSLAMLGNVLAFLGCLGLLLGVLGIFDMDLFALGLSSGIRIIGTVAIGGCLLSAIGYGVLDYFKK